MRYKQKHHVLRETPQFYDIFFNNKIVQIHTVDDIWTVTVGLILILFLLRVPQNKHVKKVIQHYIHITILK